MGATNTHLVSWLYQWCRMRIGLTGGIGSGKSTVATLFAELGIDVIDTDVIARDCVKPGSEALQQITSHFGKQILTTNAELDRAQLRQIIFNDSHAKQWLENLLHPLIRQQALQQAANSQSPFCLIVIPLYFENRADYTLDKIIVIDTPVDTQIKRLMARDQLSQEAAVNIMSQQASREERLAGADYVINNNGNIDDLQQQILALQQKLLQ